MAPTSQVFITVYYDGYVEHNPTEGLLFRCQKQKLVKVKSNFTLDQLRNAIEQKISPDHSKRVASLTYRYPVTAFGGHQYYGGFEITDEDELQLLMDHYKEYKQFGVLTSEVYAGLVDAAANFTQVTHEQSIPSSSHYNVPFSQPSQETYTNFIPPSEPQFYPSSSQTDMQCSPYHHMAPSSSNTPIDLQTTNPTGTDQEPFRMFSGVHNEDVGDFSEDEDEILERQIPDEANEATPHITPNIGVSFREPVPHFQNIGSNPEPYDEFAHFMDRQEPNEDPNDLQLGMKFETREMAQQFIQTYSINHSVEYKREETKKTVWAVVCVHENCIWRCVVRLSKKTGYWTITQLTHPHTCTASTASQDHKQLTSAFMRNHILELVRKDPGISVPVLIAHLKDLFTYQTTYRKTWIAKQKAIQTIYGDWELSYNEVNRWLCAFMHYIPGTVCDSHYQPFYEDGEQIVRKGVFQRIFWSFGPCIEGFKYCKPVVSIDGTWLYGRYKHVLLMAIAQDGNNQCFPIAYALVEGETKDAWYFFLSRLKHAVTLQDGLCLISNRHESIKSAVRDLDASWKHVFCVRHVAQNFMRRFKNTEGRKSLINMGEYLLTFFCSVNFKFV